MVPPRSLRVIAVFIYFPPTLLRPRQPLTRLCEFLLVLCRHGRRREGAPFRRLNRVLRDARPGIRRPSKIEVGIYVSCLRFDTDGCDRQRIGGDGLRTRET